MSIRNTLKFNHLHYIIIFLLTRSVNNNHTKQNIYIHVYKGKIITFSAVPQLLHKKHIGGMHVYSMSFALHSACARIVSSEGA